MRSLGWLLDASLPRRWPRNSVLERQIRSFEESCRSMRLQAGFAAFPKLWTLTCQYTAVSMSIEHWSKAFGSEFKGADYILGQLVFYRTKFQEKSKLAPNSSPALMGGWKLEFGCRYKGVLRLVDYNSLKQGHVSIVVAPDQEVYIRDERVFPLRDLAEKALSDFSDPDVRQLADVDPLPVPFIEDTPETKSKARRVYITYSRMLKRVAKVVMLIRLHAMPSASLGMRKHSAPLLRPQHLSLRHLKRRRSKETCLMKSTPQQFCQRPKRMKMRKSQSVLRPLMMKTNLRVMKLVFMQAYTPSLPCLMMPFLRKLQKRQQSLQAMKAVLEQPQSPSVCAVRFTIPQAARFCLNSLVPQTQHSVGSVRSLGFSCKTL